MIRWRSDVFHFEDGLVGYVKHLNRSKTVVSPVIHVTKTDQEKGVTVDIAMQYTDSPNELLLAFGNNINNPDGGTHVAGFKAALTRTINNYAKKNKILKELDAAFDAVDAGLEAQLGLKLERRLETGVDDEGLVDEVVVLALVQRAGDDFVDQVQQITGGRPATLPTEGPSTIEVVRHQTAHNLDVSRVEFEGMLETRLTGYVMFLGSET